MVVDRPIFVTGVPRSGTSLTTGILAACGAFTGETYGPTPWNAKGNFENKVLKDQFVKPWLQMVGADPLGLHPLPSLSRAGDVIISPDAWCGMIMKALRAQGWTDGTWVFKDCKLALQWGQWRAAFPDAIWIHVKRDHDKIVESCLRAEPMVKRLGADWQTWSDWVTSYEQMLACVPAHHVIYPERDILKNTGGIAVLVSELGLTWRPDVVNKFVDMSLWG